MMKKIFWSFIILSLGVMLFNGCSKDNSNSTPPDLPPLASMQSNFSSFGTQKSATSDIPYKAAVDTSSLNFAYAALNVGFWNLMIGVTLAVPVTAFRYSFSNKPTFIGNSTWQWSYNYNVLGGTYKARLTGEVKSKTVQWNMYIAKDGVGAFSELKWFDGSSNLDGSGGQWMLYYSVAHPDPFLQINWERTGDSVSYAKYTVVREKQDDGSVNPAIGSYIEAAYQTGDYNAYYNIHAYNANTASFDDVNIEWSTDQYFGHVKSENFYQDADWHCWDGTGKDIVCTN